MFNSINETKLRTHYVMRCYKTKLRIIQLAVGLSSQLALIPYIRKHYIFLPIRLST
jgi:hypothetical protein